MGIYQCPQSGRADHRRRSVDHGRVRHHGRRDAGLRGAIPFSPPAAAAAPRPADLRHLTVNPDKHGGLLSGTAPGRDREPRSVAPFPCLSAGR